MTERLYYTDPSILEFNAEIVEVRDHEQGFATALNRSAFYPTSGGQLHDLGEINGIGIIDVIEEDKTVFHISEKPLGNIGDSVEGKIDSYRRMRHRQQHTAQHILSHAFHTLFELRTESVHLGEEYGAVELNTEILAPEQLNRVEDLSNDIIISNYPVEILFVESSETDNLPMRKQPKRSGQLRIIKIGEIEYSACGGTHVDSTGQVQMIKIVGVEKLRKQALVKFLCGLQIKKDYDQRFELTSELTKTLTCGLNEITARFEKLDSENKSMRREMNRMIQEQLPGKALELAEKSVDVNGIPFVWDDIGNFDIKLAGILANLTAEKNEGIAALLLENRLVIAVSEKINLEAGKIARSICEKTGLKGGGAKGNAQIAGEMEPDKIKKLLTEIVGDA